MPLFLVSFYFFFFSKTHLFGWGRGFPLDAAESYDMIWVASVYDEESSVSALKKPFINGVELIVGIQFAWCFRLKEMGHWLVEEVVLFCDETKSLTDFKSVAQPI